MTLTIGRLVVEVERSSHVYLRVPRVGEMFLSLNGLGPAGQRIIFDKEKL